MRKLLTLCAFAASLQAQSTTSVDKAAAMKADLMGQIDGMKKMAQVMNDTVFSYGELGFQVITWEIIWDVYPCSSTKYASVLDGTHGLSRSSFKHASTVMYAWRFLPANKLLPGFRE